ncbi:hypothetical protein FRC03_003131 [Tulasnella sp. 419]|nr:hypothetical protein FRC03_003131 [Tulasnella sp. 419]
MKSANPAYPSMSTGYQEKSEGLSRLKDSGTLTGLSNRRSRRREPGSELSKGLLNRQSNLLLPPLLLLKMIIMRLLLQRHTTLASTPISISSTKPLPQVLHQILVYNWNSTPGFSIHSQDPWHRLSGY